jgi:opacity protein-like surface antigen
MKRLAVMALAAAFAASAALASDNDWRLRIKKEADGWSASFSGPATTAAAGTACAARASR